MIRKLLCAAVLLSLGGGPARADVTVRIATLAPEGSSWMKLFHEWSSAVDAGTRATPTPVKIKFFAGGVAGDERDVVRKMKLGSLDGGAVTAIGLGIIQPDVRVLEIPYFIMDYAELDHVRHVLDADFHKKFDEKGYVLLTWGDVGPVHLFSNEELTSVEALRRIKIWAWSDDRMTVRLFEALKLNSVKLGVPDVLTSLQTGLINACYGSPLSTLALQWNTKVKYMTSMSISQSIGATVITRRAWDAMSPAAQKVLTDETVTLGRKLLAQIREDNTRALRKMQQIGLKVVETPAVVTDEIRKQALALAPALDGEVFSGDFRRKVEKIVAEYRAARPR
jgi:TRAP-type C4-dicarboxylate transport system substrate-binding protein